MSNENKPKEQTAPIKQAPNAIQANTEVRLKELANVNRIVSNAINLINDVEIKGAHAQPVTEILGWLTGFSQSLTGQVKTLESTLPKKEREKPSLPVVKIPEAVAKSEPVKTEVK